MAPNNQDKAENSKSNLKRYNGLMLINAIRNQNKLYSNSTYLKSL